MALFKRNFNKNAKNRPIEARDYVSYSDVITAKNGTAFADLDRIASEFASLNYSIFTTNKKEKVKKHPLYSVLRQPNLEMRHYLFFYQSAKDYYNGGCYWLKVFVAGELISLFRLNPKEVTKFRDENNILKFKYNGKVYSQKEIVYIPSRFEYSTIDGGKSIFVAVKSVFDTANSMETYTQNSFVNGVVGKRMKLNIEKAYPNATPEQIKDLKSQWQKEYSGVENAGKPIIEIPGIEYSQMEGTVTDNRAAELSENRKLIKESVDAVFQMPSESFDTEKYFIFLNEFAIKPLACQFQDAINSLLDEDKFYFEFDYNGMLKVSLSTRVETEIKQINNGLLSLDEARALENRPPIEAGNTHFMPVNMMPWTEEIKKAYMAKQKNEASKTDPTDANTQHLPQGDDKQ